MDTDRKVAVSAGVLFIIATVAVMSGSALSEPLLSEPDRLARVSANASQLAGGALLQLVAAGASAGIAIALYPVLKRWGAGLALGSVVFRTVEATMYIVGVVGVLALPTLGRRLAAAGATDRASLDALGDALLGLRDQAILVGVLAFCAGALMYSWLLYRSRLVPRWLSGWGIAALFLMVVACLLALFSRNPVASYVPLVIPILVQEMVLAVWLIAKGFDAAALGAVQRQSLAATRLDPEAALAREERA